MKRILTSLLLVLTLYAQAGIIRYFPKGSTADQTHGLTEYYPDVEVRMALIVGHGIGERGDESLAALQKSSGWGGWANIKLNADKYGIILVFVNTSHDYEFGEYQYALQWVKKRYPALSNNIWVWGHSLGSYGVGKYATKDTAFVSGLAGWIASASGDFTYFITSQYQNLVKYGVKVWGVTAVNDVVSGTSPRPERELFTQMKAIDPKAYVIKTEFPNTEWPTPAGTSGSATAHNAVLSRLSQAPPYYSKGDFSLITYGIESNSILKMNVYQWMLSNPKGSIYQDPTHYYVGPQYDSVIFPTPTPIPVPKVAFREFIQTGDGVYKITWSDGTGETFRIPSGDILLQHYSRPTADGRYYFVIQTKNGLKKVFDLKK